jgi:hypothetical protein
MCTGVRSCQIVRAINSASRIAAATGTEYIIPLDLQRRMRGGVARGQLASATAWASMPIIHRH